MWVTVQHVFFLPHCLSTTCFMPFALCYFLINYFVFFIYLFYVYFLVFYTGWAKSRYRIIYILYTVCLLLAHLVFCILFCVFGVFVLFCVLFSSRVYGCLFSIRVQFTDHCHRLETQLQLIKIISYILLYHIKLAVFVRNM
jgi:hypothetical protein